MSYEIVQEQVPEFTSRSGDCVIQGSNNALIVLGTDRAKKGPASIDDGLGSINSEGGGKGSGAAMIVVGRKDRTGNPDLDKDSAYLYLSMKTDADAHVGTDGAEGSSGKTAAAILRSDSVRAVARKDLKMAIDGGAFVVMTSDSIVAKGKKVVVDSPKIELGRGASQGAVLVEQLVQAFNRFVDAFSGHVHLPGSFATATGGGAVTGASGAPTSPGPPTSVAALASKRTFVDPG